MRLLGNETVNRVASFCCPVAWLNDSVSLTTEELTLYLGDGPV
jgi:hypothetical protein